MIKYKFIVFFILFFLANILLAKNYKKVDDYVSEISATEETDLLRLTHKITSPFNSEDEKVRAIFKWITNNIEYDVDALDNPSKRLFEPKEILKHRKCVCSGYAILFYEMATISGLEAEIISGYSKGYGYEVGNIFNDSNSHAWNIVKVDNQWQLLDATWGAGYVEDNGKFIKSFNEIYFFTPPEILIKTHFPDKNKWQLLQQKSPKMILRNLFIFIQIILNINWNCITVSITKLMLLILCELTFLLQKILTW